jgi:acetyl-CoA synthetase
MKVISPSVGAFVHSAKEDPDKFWANAAQGLPWHRGWDRVFDWAPDHPDEHGRYFRWFIGGETNLAYNAVDRHVKAGNGGRAALVCEGERGGRSVLTYAQLLHEIRATAAALVRPT